MTLKGEEPPVEDSLACAKCKKRVLNGSLYCGYCGTALAEEARKGECLRLRQSANLTGKVEPRPSKLVGKIVLGLAAAAVLLVLIVRGIGLILPKHSENSQQQSAAPAQLISTDIVAPQSAPKELLWDFANSHTNWEDEQKQAINPVDVPPETVAELQDAVNKVSAPDPIHVTSALKGRFLSENKDEQLLVTVAQYHPNNPHVSDQSTYFAIVAGEVITVIPSGYLNTALRLVRVPEADVDYVLAAGGGHAQGVEVARAQVVSFRDISTVDRPVKVIADLGVTYIDSCGNGGERAVAAKVYYRPAGRTLDVLPYEHFVAGCGDRVNGFTFVKTSVDDCQKVESSMAGQNIAQAGKQSPVNDDNVDTTRISPDEQSVKRAVAVWVESFRAKDAVRNAACYAPLVETYFRRHDVSREQLQHYKQAAFERMLAIRKYDVSDVHVEVVSSVEPAADSVAYGRATAVFQKEWDTAESTGKNFSGREIEQLTFTSSPEGWKIVREEEVKILQVSRR
jgi:hypothetical protein